MWQVRKSVVTAIPVPRKQYKPCSYPLHICNLLNLSLGAGEDGSAGEITGCMGTGAGIQWTG